MGSLTLGDVTEEAARRLDLGNATPELAGGKAEALN